MAYAASTDGDTLGPRESVYIIDETDAATGSEWSLAGFPRAGVIVRWTVDLVSGTGTTVAPALGRSSGWTAAESDEIGAHDAAARIDDATEIPYRLTGGTLYGRSGVDSGTNNVIRTEIIVRGSF